MCEGLGYWNTQTEDYEKDMPRAWIRAEDGSQVMFFHPYYATSGWVTWEVKCQMDILRLIAVSQTPDNWLCTEVITDLAKRGYEVQYDFYANGAHKDVLHV